MIQKSENRFSEKITREQRLESGSEEILLSSIFRKGKRARRQNPTVGNAPVAAHRALLHPDARVNSHEKLNGLPPRR
jgi:hypothetical protein